MATVTRENVGLLNDKLTVKISKEDYYPSFEKAIKEYSKKANIPGFRKGMVPPGMVKKMYGASVFYDEVIKAVEKEMQRYLTENKPDIFAQPLPLNSDLRDLDMNSPAEYDFPFEIGLKPEIRVADLKNSNVILNKVKVTDQMIDAAVESLQTRYGKKTELDTVTSEDDILNVKFVEIDEEGNVVENGISKDSSLDLRSFTPIFRERLMGKIKNDAIQLQINSAFEEKEREWLMNDLGIDSKNADEAQKFFNITLTRIGMIEKRALDEAFFTELYPEKQIQTETEFREQVRQQIQEDWDKQSSVQLQDQLYHILIDTPMELPEEFLKKWMQKDAAKEKSAEEVEDEFPFFKNQLKWSLIKDKIARDNNIQVTQDDLRAYMQREITQYFGQTNTDGKAPWIDSYLDGMMKDEKQVSSSYNKLLTQSVLLWALSQANPVEKEVTAEELENMQHNHHH